MGNFLTLKSDNGQNIPSNQKCNIYQNIKHRPNTTWLGTTQFEGIPENLIFNLVAWLGLTILFIILRKKAWNYGRMAVLQKEELQWTEMYYEDNVSIGSGGVGNLGYDLYDPNQPTVIVVDKPEQTIATVPDNVVPDEAGVEGRENEPDPDRKSAKQSNGHRSSTNIRSLTAPTLPKAGKISEIKDTGYFSWIKIVFTLTDQNYRDKCGPDCVTYLSFQRHLIVLALIITTCSLLIILPLNMYPERTVDATTGKVVPTVHGFAKTSIVNLAGDQMNFLWAHVVLGIVYLFISIAVMRHFSKELRFHEEDSSDVSHTICIIGLRIDRCREDIVRAHIHEGYPGVDILEVSFAYNISKLQKLEKKRLLAASAKQFFQHRYESDIMSKGKDQAVRPRMRPHRCSIFGWCCGCKCCGKCQCKLTDAIDYYAAREEMFTKKVEDERRTALSHPLGIAYITFSTVEAAERIVEDYACSARLLLHTPESKYSKELHSNHWMVKFAPAPEDIYWHHLTMYVKLWYVKFLVVNFFVLLLVLLFSTPVSVFSLTQWTPEFLDSRKGDFLYFVRSVITNTIPSLLIWMLGSSLIYVVDQSDLLIGFWTRTAGNLSEMIKEFFFLIIMVCVLPALGVKSLSYFLDTNSKLSWSCIFYKDNGATFVMYVCTSSLCGAAAELMRLPSLFLYAVRLLFARSIAEKSAIRKDSVGDFPIGYAYAWVMLHFTIFTCFSVIYPLVTPFGLLYLISKHWVDRYNIYFTYNPCKVEKEVHATAVNFVVLSMFMLQINLLVYVHFYLGNDPTSKGNPSSTSDPQLRALQVFSLLGFSITAALFLGQVCFNVCADFSPIHHFRTMINDEDEILQIGRDGVVAQKHIRRRRSQETQIGQPLLEGHSSVRELTRGGSRIHIPKVSHSVQVGLTTLPELEPEVDEWHRRTSRVVSNNYTESGKPYGRYIAPLLRPEFVRLAQTSHNKETSTEPEVVVSLLPAIVDIPNIAEVIRLK